MVKYSFLKMTSEICIFLIYSTEHLQAENGKIQEYQSMQLIIKMNLYVNIIVYTSHYLRYFCNLIGWELRLVLISARKFIAWFAEK